MNKKILKLTVTAMMMALCYIGANFLKFDIPTPFGLTKFHLGNTFCILASLILGGTYGGLSGAVGMCLGDLFDPAYIASAPKTMITKFIIGFIAGTIAHKVFHIAKQEKINKVHVYIASACGAFANILVEPCISYLYYKFILDLSQKAAGAFAGVKFLTTTVNAILATIIAPTLFLVLYSRFKNNNVLKEVFPK